MSGPLAGVKVVELTGEGPGPFAGMLLSDLGCDSVRIERIDDVRRATQWSGEYRGRRSIGVDLKSPGGKEVVRRLIAGADALVEGYRPGVTERLGLGPAHCLALNPRLVYARMTGWGQDGPLAQVAGHDINYVALSGALYPIGPADGPPTPPLYILGDFAGGGLLCALGIVAALYEARASGRGQVVDAAIVDGVSLFMTRVHARRALGTWTDERVSNNVDGAAPFYAIYETADGGYVSVGAIEPAFYATLVERMGLALDELPPQLDKVSWPAVQRRFAEVFRSRTRAEWCEVMGDADACFAPVLSPAEVADHPHHRARGSFSRVGDFTTPTPAPRFDRTPAEIGAPATRAGAETREVLATLGYGPEEVEALFAAGAVAEPSP